MRVVVRTVSWVLVFAALGAAGASWFTPTPTLEVEDARQLAQDALTDAGIDVDRLSVPARMVHETGEGDTIDAWRVQATVTVDGAPEEIEVRVQESAGQLVYVDDRIGTDEATHLLSDDEFEALQQYRDSSLFDRWVRRNAFAALAAVAIAATAYLLATRSDPLWSHR